MDAHRDATAIVYNRYGIIYMNCHLNVRTITTQRLVDRVVYNFVNQVVQAVLTGRPDIHRGP